MNYENCNICNKPVGKTNSDEPAKSWEIWKWECSRRAYEIPMSLELIEKILLPKLSNKHPIKYQKIKTVLPKLKDVYKELVKPLEEKGEEILWKFFYKKGKTLPDFIYGVGGSSTWDICESCSSELESQAKSYQVDEIEGKRIMNKLEEAGVDEIKKFDFEFSEDEQEENRKEKEKLEKEFFENKEKELNNKILAEREREQIWQGCQGYQLNSFDCQW